ncbi:MAG: SDR family NAD(P)-dependent oxidoreductase, partial [Rickettsiales bacterium]
RPTWRHHKRQPDDVVLALTGRNAERLEEVAKSCRARGAHVMTTTIDVRDAMSLKNFIEQFDEKYPVDLVIANAGVSATTSGGADDIAQAQIVFDINVQGVLNTIHPLIPHMMKRKRGQIAIMSSLASFRPLPSAPSYSAAKAAVRFYGEALAGVLKHQNVQVSVICPGWIHTPLTDKNTFAMPFIMSSERAVQRIVRAVSCGKRRIVFPKRFYFAFHFLNFLSPRLTNFMFDEKLEKPNKF